MRVPPLGPVFVPVTGGYVALEAVEAILDDTVVMRQTGNRYGTDGTADETLTVWTDALHQAALDRLRP